jgi:hypothetical protein
MNIHNRSKKEVCAVQKADDQVGPHETRNAKVAVYRMQDFILSKAL